MNDRGCVCNWPGCNEPATRSSWACVVHWPMIDGKVRAKLGHAAPRLGEEPSAYFLRAGAEASAWIARRLAKRNGLKADVVKFPKRGLV